MSETIPPLLRVYLVAHVSVPREASQLTLDLMPKNSGTDHYGSDQERRHRHSHAAMSIDGVSAIVKKHHVSNKSNFPFLQPNCPNKSDALSCSYPHLHDKGANPLMPISRFWVRRSLRGAAA
jgi:hypothetical protein